jgi:predicted dehydrogenase
MPIRRSRQPVLLVGYGRRGRQWFELCRRRDDLEFVGAVDPEPSAQDMARRARLAAWPSLESALEEGRARWALIASPPGEHPDQAITCLRAGLPVLVEKPLALSFHSAVRIAQESSRMGIPAAVGQNFRYLPRERAVRKALADDFGRPESALVISARPPTVAAAHLAAIEHGAVWDICLHHLDSLRGRIGSPPATVEMTIDELPSPSAPRTHFTIRLGWDEGPVVTYVHSEGAPGFHHTEWIEGNRSAILVEDQDVTVILPSSRARRVRTPRGPMPEHAVLDEFVATVDGRGTGTLSAEENLATVAIVEAALRAAAAGSSIAPADIAASAGVKLGVTMAHHV